MVSYAWSIPKAHKKKKKRKRASSPGPGTYKDVDVNLVRVAPPEWTIKGKYPWKLESLDGPGPGTYSLKSKRPGSAYTMQGKRKEFYFKDEPGPGDYYLKQSYDNIGGYIGKKIKKKKKERSPGPAHYFPSIYDSQEGWTFGMKTGDNFQMYDSPGPGSYESYRNGIYALGKFGRERRGKTNISDGSPGPGCYSPTLPTKDGWSIQGKRKHRHSVHEGPGPGEYFPFFNEGAPAWSIAGKGKKKKKGYDDNPGPDTYFPSVHPTLPRPKSAKFTSGRKGVKDENLPGPGQYYIGSTLGGLATSLKGRPQTAKAKSNYPGPGQYKDKYKITKPRAGSAKIGRAKRMYKHDDETPGPGSYNNWGGRDFRGTKFGSSTRPGTAKTKDVPGPGSYDIRSNFGRTPGKTMGGKRRQQKSVDDTPGPGMYNPKLGGGVAYSLQGKYSTDYDIRESLKKPGPAEYFPSYDPVKPHHPGKSMGKKRKAKYDDELPGPGAYNQYMWNPKGKGWTIASRPNTAGQNNTPGPAAYFPKMGKDAPAFTMGGNYGKPFGDGMIPGPGNYDMNSDWNKGILMGKEKRLNQGGYDSEYPGPGTYYLPKNKGKGVYMGVKFGDKGFENTPGPGTYEYDGKKPGPHFSMAGTGTNGKYETVGPGPAAYNLIKSYQQVYNAKPGKSFGHKGDIKSGDKSGPGPGTYYLPKSKGKGITMKGRYPDHLNEKSPGPAAYNQKWQTIQNMVDSQNLVSGGNMGKSVDFYHSGNMPGPGAYYSPSKLTNIGTKFGKDRRGDMKSSENPGPGYYYIPCTVADVPKYVYPNPDPRYKWV